MGILLTAYRRPTTDDRIFNAKTPRREGFYGLNHKVHKGSYGFNHEDHEGYYGF